MLWVFSQVREYNEAWPIVSDYLKLETSAKLGFGMDGEKLYDFELEAFRLIEIEFARLENEKMKRESKRKR